ncbi:MAG TPA: indole-3-glycerol phosphate synthase TrpC [Euzebyales bacterium]
MTTSSDRGAEPVDTSSTPRPQGGARQASSFLSRVCAEARERVADARRQEPLGALRTRAAGTADPPPFGPALRGGIIAEVKRASPSRGVIAADRDAATQARGYVDGGAAAISVLTEPGHFHGSLDDLAAVASAVPVPVLRKDFIVDAYQVYEARVAGAAAVLLLVAALDQAALVDLLHLAVDAGVDALVETHAADEVDRAVAAVAALPDGHPPVIGVNARDLRRLMVDRSRFAELAAMLPRGAVVVAESGVSGPADVAAYRRAGAHAVLVGEHLMLATDPVAATRTLVDAARNPTLSDSS